VRAPPPISSLMGMDMRASRHLSWCVAALADADADAGLLPPRAQVVLPVHMRVGILYLPSHFVGHCVSRCWVVSLPLNPVPDHQAHRSRRGTPLVYKRFIPLPLQNFISTLLLDMSQHALSPWCQIQCSLHHGQIQCHLPCCVMAHECQIQCSRPKGCSVVTRQSSHGFPVHPKVIRRP